jgi:hypothetical protein
MKTELKEFIDSQEQDLRPTLYQYYDLYLKLRANGDAIKASNDTLAFFQRNQQDLELNVDHEIDKMENNNFMAYGLKKRKRKRTRKSKKSKRSKKTKRTKTSRRR